MKTQFRFSYVICNLCNRKVKPFDLPERLPKTIILRCSNCNSNKDINAVWRTERFKFTEKGISKETIMIYLRREERLEEERALEEERETARMAGDLVVGDPEPDWTPIRDKHGILIEVDGEYEN